MLLKTSERKVYPPVGFVKRGGIFGPTGMEASVKIIFLSASRRKPRASAVSLGPDYMSRAGPVSRVASVGRDDFQPGIT